MDRHEREPIYLDFCVGFVSFCSNSSSVKTCHFVLELCSRILSLLLDSRK